jgi:hypothetical protein
MEYINQSFALKEIINVKRERLNNMIIEDGINEEIIKLSEELDELILQYTLLNLSQKQK